MSKELIKKLANKTSKSHKFTKMFVKEFIELLKEELKENHRVNLPGFGTFKSLPQWYGPNFPLPNWEKVEYQKICFKASKGFKKYINEQE
ncbi:HU family DNA-binding protein [Mycoplasma sp. 4404]|uniref:HU family DNA-binding protein n=1 Tax=Mycoplasma sp. 4404 TaxID=3108530 RepID=UPI002B1D88A3|nr:HU family DNA-binding protein [Mycoplasma sp. 4404]MEA4162617.1 HU family DNA-binding protein [Mycoplasma sp. 4404]